MHAVVVGSFLDLRDHDPLLQILQEQVQGDLVVRDYASIALRELDIT